MDIVIKKKIDLLEENLDWKGAVELFQSSKVNEIDGYLRLMFILVDYLCECQYSKEDYDNISNNLKEIYHQAKKQYSENSQFLFFSAIMIYIGEWYFGMDSLDEATDMLNRAMELSPDNIIYKWGYFSITDQRVEINTEMKHLLSRQILNDNLILDWLKNMGLLGEYVLGIIQSIYNEIKTR
ncbi:MAG: hypothetical protein V4666_06145 [Bacteroidota bacterium]